MGNVNTILILSLILNVITLICFFILCSNISHIKRKLCDEDSRVETRVKFLLKYGNKEMAKKYFVKNAMKNKIFSDEFHDDDYVLGEVESKNEEVIKTLDK